MPSPIGGGTAPRLDFLVIQHLSQRILTALDLWSSDPQVRPGETLVEAVGPWFKSRARNHVQANRSLAFRFDFVV